MQSHRNDVTPTTITDDPTHHLHDSLAIRTVEQLLEAVERQAQEMANWGCQSFNTLHNLVWPTVSRPARIT